LIRTSGTTTLFTEQADPGLQPVTFVGSLVVHSLAFAVVWFALSYKPPFTRVVTDHFSVRKLDLRMPDLPKPSAQAKIPNPAPHPNPHKPAPAAPALAAQLQTAKSKIGPQTLVQPDLPKPITLAQEVPLPQIVMWSKPKVELKTITPPQLPKPASAEAKPSVATPNDELKLDDVNIASSFHPSPQNIIQPSTTSPIQVHAPEDLQTAPVTSAQSTLQPTPAAILSLSDLRAANQTVALPPVNETNAANTEGLVGSGPAQKSPSDLNNPNAKMAGVAGSGANSGGDQNSGATATLITVPKEGRFGAVIVGDVLQDQYPEIANIWSGRLAYSAFLHVGLAKSWILQYSLPRASDPSGGGTVARLDAPWPYSIVRPNLEPGTVEADAVMIHGFVNKAGHFETLSVVFPEGFQRAQFVLAALQQWQFRPAAQDGQPARVEVLLIIPEQYE
jgi:hypothetical protein